MVNGDEGGTVIVAIVGILVVTGSPVAVAPTPVRIGAVPIYREKILRAGENKL